ncbi:NlpC/P60 family protein [Leucobacter sp. HY1910]
MSFNHSTDLVVSDDTPKQASFKMKRAAQMAGAAVLSFGLVGTFSIPAYATAPEVQGMPDGFANVQTLETVDADSAPLALDAPEGVVDSAILEQERIEAEAKKAEEEAAAAAAAAKKNSEFSGKDVPAGVGAQGIVTAALAQLGDIQDCTALVERALRAVGIPAGDLGTQVGEYTGLGGTLVTSGDYAPGDVLIWSGRHVAVYIGNGQAVHGGYGGNQTVVAGAFIDGSPDGVVRFG